MKKKPTHATINVKGTEITVIRRDDEDFISLTDMRRAKDGDFFISDWLRNRNTVDFLGIRETVHNPKFNSGAFAIMKSQAGLNSYKLSVKEWNGSKRPTPSACGRRLAVTVAPALPGWYTHSGRKPSSRAGPTGRCGRGRPGTSVRTPVTIKCPTGALPGIRVASEGAGRMSGSGCGERAMRNDAERCGTAGRENPLRFSRELYNIPGNLMVKGRFNPQ